MQLTMAPLLGHVFHVAHVRRDIGLARQRALAGSLSACCSFDTVPEWGCDPAELALSGIAGEPWVCR